MTDETTDGTVPGVPQDTPVSVPPPLNPAPPDFDPFADDKGAPVLSQTPTPLMERMKLHFKEAQTKEAPFGALSHFGETAIERGARERGNPSDLENEAIDRAVKTRDDLENYDRMPGAEGFLEYGAAVLGHIAGNAADPTSLIGDVVKIPYLAGKGIVGLGARFGISEGASATIGRLTSFGVNQAIVNTATDPVIQGLNIASDDGTRENYDYLQTLVGAPIGGFVGGALLKGAHEAGSALFVRPQAEKDALTFFKILRDYGTEEERKRWPEIFDGVQGKSDKELSDMARQIGQDDKAAGEAAKSKTPTAQEAADKISQEAPPGSETSVDINGKKATSTATSKLTEATDQGAMTTAEGDLSARIRGEGGEPLSIKEAVEAEPVAPDMVRLYRGGGNNPGGPKWVTTDRRYAERYTTPGLAYSDKVGSFLHYVDVPATDPRVQIPEGQSVHSFEAPPEIADRLRPFYREKQPPATLASHNNAIGDVLAAQYDRNRGPTEPDLKGPGAAPPNTLDLSMRQMEGSAPRPPQAALGRSSLTSNLVEAPNIRKIWTDLGDAFGATVRQGRLVSKNAAGEFTLKSGVIRMRQLDDPVVFAHELGHHAEYTNKDLKALIDTHPTGAELDGLTAYSAGQKSAALIRTEGFAEFFRLFVENPNEAQRRAPGFFAEFNKYLDTKPDFKGALLKAQRDFDNYRMANASDLVYANIHTSTEPKGWAKLRADVRNDGFWNTIADRGSQVYTGIIDEKNPLAVAVRQLLKTQKDNTGKIISLIAADDPYKLIRLATNAHNAGMIDLMHGVVPWHSITPEGPGLFDAIVLATGKPNILSGWDEVAIKKFNGYLISRRGVFEWERRTLGQLDKDPMPERADVYAQQIKEYEAENPNARAAADMVTQFAHNMLKKELEAGITPRDAYDEAMKIRDYVPLMRDMSDKTNVDSSRPIDMADVGLKQFRGSSRPIIDPLQSLMTRAFRTAEFIAHNDAIKALASLADKAGVGAGALVERVAAKEVRANYVQPLEAMRKGLEAAGVPTPDAKLAIAEMLNDLQINGQSIGPVSIFRKQQTSARGENLIFYLSGGELNALRLKDGDFGRELVNILTGGLSAPLRDWNLSLLAKGSQILRAGVVTSPDFFIPNILRDQVATWLMNRGTIPLVDSIRGIYREITNNELARSFSQMGGIAGGANLNAIDHARIDKDIQSLASKGFTIARIASWEGYFKIMELSETASRVGLFETAYKRSLKQGLSPYEASVEAAFTANDNLDFGRHGSRIGATIKIIPFLNAQLQGLDKAWRTLGEPIFKEKLTKQDQEAWKTMWSAYAKIAALTGASMALRAAYIDDPEYSELSPYLRNTNWIVRVPGVKGNKIIDMFGKTIEVPPGLQNLWLAIPKPFELAIFPNLGERGVEMLANKDPKALARWAWGALDLVQAKWMMDSTLIKNYVEMRTGKDWFTGGDIVPEAVAGRDPWAQATANTSEISKAIGKAADRAERALGLDGGGLSPMYIDHLVKGVGGNWGRTFLSGSDAAMGTKGDQSLAETAITRRIFKESYNGSTSLQEFWSAVGKTNGDYAKAANTYDALASNPSEQASYVARLPEDKRAFVIMTKSDFPADEKRLHPLQRSHDAISTLSNMKREIADDNLSESATLDPIKLSSSERRVALDSLSRIQMWEARNALIVAGHPALKGQKPGPIDADMEMLEKTVPSVYGELAQRYANAKVYKASSVAEHWDEVKQSVIDEGSSAKLSGIAREVQRDGFELDEKANKKKKVRPVIPGALEEVQ